MAESLSPGEVLAIAKGSLYRLLPSLPKEDRLQGRMILKAMAIAQRALEKEGGMDDSAREALARGLREGAIEDTDSLRQTLREDVERRLAITNPKALTPQR